MTWNVENLFRPPGLTAADYQKKLQGLAAVIKDIDPTVVALQEVGSPEALQDLVKQVGGTWHVELSEFPDSRGIRVGFMSRQELFDKQDIVDFPQQLVPVQVDDQKNTIDRPKRGLLAVSVRVGSKTLRMVTAHLKSKLISYPGGRFNPNDENERARYGGYAVHQRTAEAVTARTYCNDYLAGKGTTQLLALLGDMNDEAGAATTEILVGPPGSEIGTTGESRPDQGDNARLFNLAPLLPEAERHSRIYLGRPELIDHILVSRALLGSVDRTSVRAAYSTRLPSVTDNPNERPPAEASDHAPLVVVLQIS
jgi:endonuclease/exonuclease/phosphatase family metal-dependent hydrolase